MLSPLLLLPLLASAANTSRGSVSAVLPLVAPAASLGPVPPVGPGGALPGADLKLAANRALFSAAKAGDIPRMEAALAAGAALDFVDEGHFGQTPLLAAAAARKAPAVRFLAGKGADRNARDNMRSNAVIYASMSGDLEMLQALGSPEGLELLALDFGGRSAFDHARSGGHDSFAAKLDESVRSVDLRSRPEQYLVVNFVGFGGGGATESRELEKDPRVGHVLRLRRNRKDKKEAREVISRWMEHDVSKGGPMARNVVIVGSSWGSAPAAALARWFEKKFGFKPRLNVMVEAANIVGLPYGKIGPADETKSYHIEGRHWPTGGFNKNAGTNVSLGDTDHDSGLFLGAQAAVEDIKALLARQLTRTGAALQELIWSRRVLPSAYPGPLPKTGGGVWKALRALLTAGKTFDSEGDELPKSRGGFKLLHPFGSVLKIRYATRPGHGFTGVLAGRDVPGLARLSLGAAQKEGGAYIPGTALKLFVDGNPSVNAVFLGEKTGVDGQQPETDFFSQRFTNDLPKPRTRVNKIAAFVLGLFNRGNALRIPVDHFAAVNADGTRVAKPKAAHRLWLKPAAGRATPSGSARDFRDELAALAPGSLFEVWAAASAEGPLVHVGDIEALTAPVASEYGDKGLFFRHRR
jgi:hypothetical protein